MGACASAPDTTRRTFLPKGKIGLCLAHIDEIIDSKAAEKARSCFVCLEFWICKTGILGFGTRKVFPCTIKSTLLEVNRRPADYVLSGGRLVGDAHAAASARSTGNWMRLQADMAMSKP